MTLAVNIAQSGSNNVTFRNRVINGNMVVDQRASGTVTLDTNTRFIVDRFFAEDDSTATVTGVQSTTAPAGFINSILFTVTTADSSIAASENCQLRHWIEGLNVSDLGWGTANAQTVTLSFWVRSSVTGTHSGALLNSAANRNYVFSYTISTANTFEYKTITIAGDTSGTWLTTNGRGIGLFWNLGSGSTFLGTAGVWGSSVLFGATGSIQLISTLNATFYITGAQLEAGTTASPFEYRQYGTEFQLCQRYFSLMAGGGACGTAESTNRASVTYQFPVPMRATPTGTLNASKGSLSQPQGGPNSLTTMSSFFFGTTATAEGGWCVIDMSGTPWTTGRVIINNGTTGMIQFSAEL